MEIKQKTRIIKQFFKEQESWRTYTTSLTRQDLLSFSDQNSVELMWWNRIDSKNTTVNIYGQLIFVQGTKASQWRKDGFYNWYGKNWISQCENIAFDLYFYNIQQLI